MRPFLSRSRSLTQKARPNPSIHQASRQGTEVKTVTQRHRNLPIRHLALLLTLACSAILAPAQELKTIDPPGGGKIMYGQVAGQSTEAGAMAYILRNLHQNLGEKPQVGKLFDVKGTQSVAVFFSVSRHDQGAGKKPLQIGGLIIATKVSTDHVEAALVSDGASRFPKTLNPMMKTLFTVWHPIPPGVPTSTGGTSAPAAQLRQTTLPDNSASIGLPEGWQIAPRLSGGGTIVALGPNGESAEMDITFLAADPRNPSVQQTLQQLRNGRLQNTAYASAIYYQYGGDLSQTFVYMMQHVRQKAGLPQATYHFTSVTPMPAGGQQTCTHMVGTGDMNDGKGPRELNAVYCETPPGRFGNWMSEAYTTMAPQAVAAKERATLAAIMQSFNVNMQVVQQQANRIAAPAIDQIHAIGRASAEQAKAAHQMEDIHNSSVYQHWDSNDKRSQEFENYQLGYSVISTSDNQYHGTFWNEDADAIVKSHPDKFEYVNAPDYWKGIDY